MWYQMVGRANIISSVFGIEAVDMYFIGLASELVRPYILVVLTFNHPSTNHISTNTIILFMLTTISIITIIIIIHSCIT